MLRPVLTTLVWLLACGGAASSQALSTIPRTPEGRPDFQGTWSSDFLPTMIERVPGATALVVGDDEARELADASWARHLENSPVYDPHENLGMARSLARVNGEWRTSMITDPPDGKAPLTDKARQLIAEDRDMAASPAAEGYEVRPWKERCIRGFGGAPLIVSPTDNLKQIVQTPDHLMIYVETDVGEARIVGIGAAHRPTALTSLIGDSVALWEGDVLVIETTGVRNEQVVRQSTLVIGAGSRVIERLSFLSPDEVLYRFTIEDPAIYSRPWSAEYSLKRSSAPIFETACHEANYSLTNILSAARESERVRAQSPAKPQR